MDTSLNAVHSIDVTQLSDSVCNSLPHALPMSGKHISPHTIMIAALWASLTPPVSPNSSQEKLQSDGRADPSVEIQIDIPHSRKDDFQREIMNYIGASGPAKRPENIAFQTATTSHAAFRCF